MNHEPSFCPRCGVAFECNPQNISACHCSTIKLHKWEQLYIAAKFKDCLCNNCLNDLKIEFARLPEYYIEGGLYVFTEKFHIKRGACCKNGCRHCPFRFKQTEIVTKK